jgi:ATP-dependent RNA helicase DeaD
METVRFEEMGLSEEIQKAVRYMGFEEASPIQAKAIPAMISGIDLIGQAQTGTGKTELAKTLAEALFNDEKAMR